MSGEAEENASRVIGATLQQLLSQEPPQRNSGDRSYAPIWIVYACKALEYDGTLHYLSLSLLIEVFLLFWFAGGHEPAISTNPTLYLF